MIKIIITKYEEKENKIKAPIEYGAPFTPIQKTVKKNFVSQIMQILSVYAAIAVCIYVWRFMNWQPAITDISFSVLKRRAPHSQLTQQPPFDY